MGNACCLWTARSRRPQCLSCFGDACCKAPGLHASCEVFRPSERLGALRSFLLSLGEFTVSRRMRLWTPNDVQKAWILHGETGVSRVSPPHSWCESLGPQRMAGEAHASAQHPCL